MGQSRSGMLRALYERGVVPDLIVGTSVGYRAAPRLVVLPPPCPLSVLPIDFSATDRLMDFSYRESSAYLDALDAGSAEAPLRMSMHRH